MISDKDKDTEGILDAFTKAADDFITTEIDAPRKEDKEILADRIRNRGKNVSVADSPDEAVRMACEKQNDYRYIIYAGSLYFIGEVRRKVIRS